jgi:hypothetical protein
MISGDLVHGRRVESLEGMVSIEQMCLISCSDDLAVITASYGVRYQKKGRTGRCEHVVMLILGRPRFRICKATRVQPSALHVMRNVS